MDVNIPSEERPSFMRDSNNFKNSTAAFLIGALAASGVGYAVANPEAQQRRGEPQRAQIERGYVQQLSFADLVEDVSPAVVSIRTTRQVEGRMAGLPPEFQRMLPPQLRGRGGEGEPREAVGEGSGFFIDADGHIVTNNHVIDGATEIVVTLSDGDELVAELVGADAATDLAVLRVEPSRDQRYVQFSPNTDLRVGDYVLAVGNPFGLGGSVTSGIVSAIGGDRARAGQYADFIQIDASINRGNSGGPTFDLRGNVVGVNTAIISPTGGNVGIGLAVPADTAADVTRQLIENGAVSRGWLGVSIRDVDDTFAEAIDGLSEATGAFVGGVADGAPAASAGIREGDVILRFGDQDIDSAQTLTRTVGRTAPGERVRVRLLRDGERRTVTVRLTEREAEEQVASAFGTGAPGGGADTALGDVRLSSLDDETRRQLNLGEDVTGVLVTDVASGSEAAEAGIRRGMVITEADSRDVRTVRDLERTLATARERGKGAVLVRVVTSQGSDFRALPVNEG